MAAPKKKTSKSNRGKRRSHNMIKVPNISFNSITKTPHYSHMMSKDGIYGKKNFIANKSNKQS